MKHEKDLPPSSTTKRTNSLYKVHFLGFVLACLGTTGLITHISLLARERMAERDLALFTENISSRRESFWTAIYNVINKKGIYVHMNMYVGSDVAELKGDIIDYEYKGKRDSNIMNYQLVHHTKNRTKYTLFTEYLKNKERLPFSKKRGSEISFVFHENKGDVTYCSHQQKHMNHPFFGELEISLRGPVKKNICTVKLGDVYIFRPFLNGGIGLNMKDEDPLSFHPPFMSIKEREKLRNLIKVLEPIFPKHAPVSLKQTHKEKNAQIITFEFSEDFMVALGYRLDKCVQDEKIRPLIKERIKNMKVHKHQHKQKKP